MYRKMLKCQKFLGKLAGWSGTLRGQNLAGGPNFGDCWFIRLKAASHRIRLRLTIRLMANGSLTTSTKKTIIDNTGNPAYLKQF